MKASCEWRIDRVRNYTSENIKEYLNILKEVDGNEYDPKVLGKKLLEKEYIKIDNFNKMNETKKEKTLKRKWGSYIGPMTALGLGRKENGFLYLTEVAKLYLENKITYEELLTHQFLKYQIPNGNSSDLKELKNKNVKLKPYVLILRILIDLAKGNNIEPWIDRYEIKKYVSDITNHIDDDSIIKNRIDKIYFERHNKFNFNEHNISKESVKDVIAGYDIFENAFLNTKYINLKEKRIITNGKERKFNVLALNLNFFDEIKEKLKIYENKFIEFTEDQKNNENIWIDYYGKYYENKEDKNNKLKNNILVELDLDKSVIKRNSIIDRPHNLIVYGAPGTGKSHSLKNDVNNYFDNNLLFKRVTFHPQYNYANFLGTYKPVPIYQEVEKNRTLYDIDKKTKLKNQKEPLIDYQFIPGTLLIMLTRALKFPKYNFLILIEELNRANVSSVFGDAFQLLDRNEKGESKFEVVFNEDIMNYLKKEIGNINSVKLPDNLYLWATMNNADQGVHPLDSAFKRRWNFKYIGINEKEEEIKNIEVYIKGLGKVNWNLFRRKINTILTPHVNEDKLIGPFFIPPKILKDPKKFNYAYENKFLMYLCDDILRNRNKEILFNKNNFSNIIEIQRSTQSENIYNNEIDFSKAILEK